MDSDSLVQDLQKVRAGRRTAWLIVAVSLLALVPPLASNGPWGVWLFAGLAYCLVVFLLWRQLLGFDFVRGIITQQRDTFKSDKESLLQRAAECERRLAQIKRESENRSCQWEKERTDFVRLLEEEKKRSATHKAEYDQIQQALAQLNHENGGLARQEAEAISRRQSLQKQYSDLEKTAGEMKAAYTEKAESQRRALTELDKLKCDLKETQAQRGHAQAEVERLKRQLETLAMEQSNILLRETKSKNETAQWKVRAEAVESEIRNLKGNAALQEELASRRTEIERLCQKIENLTQQRDLADERGQLLERERKTLTMQLPALNGQIESLQQVIGELQDECRNGHQEPRHEMARHFAWKLNFFKDQEVVLNFLNEGAEVDLVEVRTEPELTCEIVGKRLLAKRADGRVRVSALQRLPEEFLLTVRYTIYPQQAVLRIRPFDSPKLERL
jgi:chromosome segregation ATPase